MPKLFLKAALFSVLLAGAAHAQDPNASQAQDLANCAGAVAAHADLDALNHPRGASGEWAPVLSRILDRLNREPGVEGLTGRYAASAAQSYWAEQPPAQRGAEAQTCRTRFGG